VQHLCATLYSVSNIVPNDYLVREAPDDPDRVLEPPEERIEPELDERIEEPTLDERTEDVLDERIVEDVPEERVDELVERVTDGVVLREGLVVVVRTVVLVEREGMVADVFVRVVRVVAVVAAERVVAVVAAERVVVVVAAERVVAVVLGRLTLVARTLELPYVRFIDDV
jgi:hypothetical protein